jgi:hypothetical protein
MVHLQSRSLLVALLSFSLGSALPATAQFIYPDGTVRSQTGIIQSGPDPRRLLSLPSQQRFLDSNSGAIYDGSGLMRQGPNPSRTLPTWTGGW